MAKNGKWTKGVNNGVVFLIATEDRTMSIQQGRAVEQYITASTAKQILDYLVTPSFKQGQWYNGIDRGTYPLLWKLFRGNLNPRKSSGTKKEVILLLSLFLFYHYHCYYRHEPRR